MRLLQDQGLIGTVSHTCGNIQVRTEVTFPRNSRFARLENNRTKWAGHNACQAACTPIAVMVDVTSCLILVHCSRKASVHTRRVGAVVTLDGYGERSVLSEFNPRLRPHTSVCFNQAVFRGMCKNAVNLTKRTTHANLFIVNNPSHSPCFL